MKQIPMNRVPMNRVLWMLLGASLLLSGCDKFPDSASLLGSQSTSTSKQTVAVLDLAAVAKALGRDEIVKQQVQAAGEQLRQQLANFSTELQDKLREQQAKLGSNPSEDERQQLQRQLVEAQRQVQQSQALARQKAVQFQNQLAVQFRNEIQPVAAEIARAQGASAIAMANTLMWFDPALDITGAVIDAMRAKGTAPTLTAPTPSDKSGETPGESGTK